MNPFLFAMLTENQETRELPLARSIPSPENPCINRSTSNGWLKMERRLRCGQHILSFQWTMCAVLRLRNTVHSICFTTSVSRQVCLHHFRKRHHHAGRNSLRWPATCSLQENPFFTAKTGSAIRSVYPVSYTHLRAHETDSYLVC